MAKLIWVYSDGARYQGATPMQRSPHRVIGIRSTIRQVVIGGISSPFHPDATEEKPGKAKKISAK